MKRTELHEYADEVGLFFQEQGVPLMPGRVLGWLLVCDPPQQSAEEIAEAVQASRGAISMAMQMLQTAGAVEKVKVAGTRRIFYRLRPGFWLREAEEKARVARDWHTLMARGLKLMDEQDEDQRQRVREAHDMYEFLAAEYGQIKDRWAARRAES
ncbi:GbsR/MarR family transcriptional regulator [Crossiella cryophila]|uniref:DNA-binding transcriptional regulator GbsR (MarR family) n=1 Tax=Crossiella cryophila TaxID=43355 RepID=A0A7W7CD09_9PSEU|nr:transcriptional regulator [Crossiella cryophila]MBB4678883.1 DNA-binding transcriptional regulator GbsR (MarR family) [Crossiella cryophila]